MPIIACPNCTASLRVKDGATHGVKCPLCHADLDSAASTGRSSPKPLPQIKTPAASPAAGSPRAAKSHAGTAMALGLVALVVLLASAILAARFLSSTATTTSPNGEQVVVDSTEQSFPHPKSNLPNEGSDTTVPALNPSSPAKPKSETESDFIRKLVGSMSLEEQQQVKKAIDKGIAYLRSRDDENINRLQVEGVRSDKLFDIGCHVLIGWTLLECGLPATDRQVLAVAQRVREAGRRLTHTYALSLAVIFLNKLGDTKDHDLIRTLALRLIAGQNRWGGWKYNCPILGSEEERQLLDFLRATSPAARIGIIERGSGNNRENTELPGRLKELAVVDLDPSLPSSDRPPEPTGGNPWNDHRLDDNSNTQFAILGVWSALRHGVPVDRTAALVRMRFQQTQNHDHSWSYLYRVNESPIPQRYERRDAMTCAGLLGLALANVTQDWERQDRGEKGTTNLDRRIDNGLKYLGGVIGVEHGKTKDGDLPIGADSLGDLYFLWSLERVGVLYRQTHIGGKAWYSWGARLLVRHQRDDGSWHDRFGADVNTCFALLYLKCANPVSDLSRMLEALDIPQRLRLPTAIPAQKRER